MAKESFLVVSLRETRAKKLAQVISNETSIKILDYLANKDATETELAKELSIPISTVHYNMKVLVDARLVKSNEFHYSDKGKEMKHYRLANKYIIIAPEKETGLRDRLRALLPVSIILIAAAAAWQFIPQLTTNSQVAPKMIADAGQERMMTAAPMMASTAAETSSFFSSLPFWFIIGAASALILYILVSWIRERN
jgi:DNA-binding transcriptional ArsR family regulator